MATTDPDPNPKITFDRLVNLAPAAMLKFVQIYQELDDRGPMLNMYPTTDIAGDLHAHLFPQGKVDPAEEATLRMLIVAMLKLFTDYVEEQGVDVVHVQDLGGYAVSATHGIVNALRDRFVAVERVDPDLWKACAYYAKQVTEVDEES